MPARRRFSWRGRRSGKTRSQAAVGLWHCMPREEFEAYTLPHEPRKALVVATTLEQAMGVIEAALTMILGSPLLSSMVRKRRGEPLEHGRDWARIAFKHNVIFEAMACNARGDRGRGASFIGLDEYAHHFDSLDRLGQATAAEALFAAVVPAASQYKELKTVIIGSTPSGDSNKFAKLRDIALEHPSRQSVYFHGATWEINPRIDEEDLGQERLTLGEELFRQEFQADFLSGGGYFLTNDAIERCVEERGDMSYEHGREYVVGIDPALSSDVFGCVVLGVDRFQGKLSVAQVHGWEGQRSESWEGGRIREDVLMERIVEVCHAYRCRLVATDVFKSREITQRLREHGIQTVEVPFNGERRREVFASLRAAIDERKLSLPNHPELLRELRALRVRYTSQGQKVELARIGRSHCDRAVALALAISAADQALAQRPLAVLKRAPAGYSSVRAAVGNRYGNSVYS